MSAYALTGSVVHRIIIVSVLQRLNTTAASALRFSVPLRSYGIKGRLSYQADCRKPLEEDVISSNTGENNGVTPRGGGPTVGRP